MILTKQPNFFDPSGDTDRQDVIDAYKGKEGKMYINILNIFY